MGMLNEVYTGLWDMLENVIFCREGLERYDGLGPKGHVPTLRLSAQEFGHTGGKPRGGRFVIPRIPTQRVPSDAP